MEEQNKIVRSLGSFMMSWCATAAYEPMRVVHVTLVRKKNPGKYGVFFVQTWLSGALESEQDYRQETAAIAAWVSEMPRVMRLERADEIAKAYEEAILR